MISFLFLLLYKAIELKSDEMHEDYKAKYPRNNYQ